MANQTPSNDARTCALDLIDFITASPTPAHCVLESVVRLGAHGFTELCERETWKLEPGASHYVIRDGSLIAFRVGSEPAPSAGFRLIGAHTDSPNLRVKPNADVRSHGYMQLGVETYGGLLSYTWLDRDLGLAGRVMTRKDNKLTDHLVRIDRPILRVPSLAIHLNRKIRTEGLKLNAQKHLPPLLGLCNGDNEASALKDLLGKEIGVDARDILSWDLSLMDTTAPILGGLNEEFIFAPRMDNQAMCHAALCALLSAEVSGSTQVICLYDHEEVGSRSASGAAGALVEDVLRRLAEISGPGSEPGGLTRAAAGSIQISADMAHGVHPNYSDRHDPQHMPHLNKGPVIKINTEQRYATDAYTAGVFELLCLELDIPFQKFINRTDLSCGSTIGPISASRLGVRTVDVGNPMLSMHSIREQGGRDDPARMVAVMTSFLQTRDFYIG